MSEALHICVIIDDAFAVPSITMLNSVKVNKRPESSYVVHCVVDSLSRHFRNSLEKLNSQGFDVLIHEGAVSEFAELGLYHTALFPLNVYIRWGVYRMFPNLDKLLYLDGDILVFDDLTPLWSVPLGDNLVAAVRDMDGEVRGQRHESVGCRYYFNSGVLLMNLKQMREENILPKLIQLRQSAPLSWELPDQDPLNKVCDGRVTLLPPRYNAMIPNIRKFDFSASEFDSFYGTSYGAWPAIAQDVVILHLAGTNGIRPWQMDGGIYGTVWQKYYDSSPLGNMHLRRVLPSERDCMAGRSSVTSVWLLGFLQFLKIKADGLNQSYLLFGCIPLLIKKWKMSKCSWLLFGFIPLMRTKTKSTAVYHQLN